MNFKKLVSTVFVARRSCSFSLHHHIVRVFLSIQFFLNLIFGVLDRLLVLLVIALLLVAVAGSGDRLVRARATDNCFEVVLLSLVLGGLVAICVATSHHMLVEVVLLQRVIGQPVIVVLVLLHSRVRVERLIRQTLNHHQI